MTAASLTGNRNYFEDFSVGDRYRHARGTTVGEVENQLLTKLVMNTAHAHFNGRAVALGSKCERPRLHQAARSSYPQPHPPGSSPKASSFPRCSMGMMMSTTPRGTHA